MMFRILIKGLKLFTFKLKVNFNCLISLHFLHLNDRRIIIAMPHILFATLHYRALLINVFNLCACEKNI